MADEKIDITPKPAADPKGEKGAAESEAKGIFSSPIRLKLTDEQKSSVIALINDEMGRIKKEYGDRGYFEHIENSQAEYDAKREYADFPVEDASNRKILLTTLSTDVVVSKAKRQTHTANPIILLEKDEEMADEDLRDREDLLDFRLREGVKLEELDVLAYRMACLQGAAIIKVPFDHSTEWHTYKETYRPTLEDMARFEKDYAKELGKRDSEEYKQWQKLRDGEQIDIISEEEVVVKHSPTPYRVPLNKFYARLSIKDFSRHRVIAEEMDFAWADIHTRMRDWYDEEAVEELKKKYSSEAVEKGEVDKPYDRRDYKIYEAIVSMDLKSDGKYKKYVVTFDTESDIILRAIHFPYNHNKIFYVLYNAIPKDDSWLGYSFYERLLDPTEIINAFINSAINEFTIAHNSIILTDDPTFQGGRKEVGHMSVLTFAKGTLFREVRLNYPGSDRMAFVQWMHTMSELITGVSAALMSGRETPGDPRAPASKTAMKLQESNARVEDIVMNLQKGDEALAEQVDALYYQYPDSESDEVVYYRSKEEKKVSRGKIYGRKVRYVCHGSRLSFDRSVDLEIAMQTIQFLSGAYPEVMRDADVRYELLNIVLNASQGSVERNKDTILQPIKNIIEARKEMPKLLAKIKEQGEASPEDEKMMGELMKAAQMAPPQAQEGQGRGQ